MRLDRLLFADSWGVEFYLTPRMKRVMNSTFLVLLLGFFMLTNPNQAKSRDKNAQIRESGPQVEIHASEKSAQKVKSPKAPDHDLTAKYKVGDKDYFSFAL